MQFTIAEVKKAFSVTKNSYLCIIENSLITDGYISFPFPSIKSSVNSVDFWQANFPKLEIRTLPKASIFFPKENKTLFERTNITAHGLKSSGRLFVSSNNIPVFIDEKFIPFLDKEIYGGEPGKPLYTTELLTETNIMVMALKNITLDERIKPLL